MKGSGYRPDFPHGKTMTALCQGVRDHALCSNCSRCVPGPRTAGHLLEVPAHNLTTCDMYRRQECLDQ
jgi:hypothetical protein